MLEVGAQAIPPLRDVLGTQSRTVKSQRAIAAEALGLLEAMPAWPDLAQHAVEDHLEVRICAVRALGQLGVPDAGDAVVECLQSGEPTALRAAAARALGRIGDRRHTPALVACVHDSDYAVAHNAAEALTALGDDGRRTLGLISAEPGLCSVHAREALASRASAAAPALRVGRDLGSRGGPVGRPGPAVCDVDRVTDTLIQGFAWFAIGYFLVLNTWYLGLILLAARATVATARRSTFDGHEEIFHSPLAPAISIVVPCQNQERTIVSAVRGLLHLRYPALEVIVIDDGSTDETFDRLRDDFDLVEVPRVIRDDLVVVGEIGPTYAPRNREPLLLIRKASIGRDADAVNLGINAARHSLVCRVDARTSLDQDALLAIVQPFIDDPANIVAVGATIRVANGCTIEHGRVTDARLPTGWLARVQAVEYLRSFLVGRSGRARVGGMLFACGAFGLFRREVLVSIGGADVRSDGDDLELITRLHHELRRSRQPYQLAFVSEPCCWTEVPATYRTLARQRRRYSQALAQTLWTHRPMIANPRYGFQGLVVAPYYLGFELLGAVVELVALPVFVAGLLLGIVSPAVALWFVVVAIAYPTLLTILALAIEEFSYHRYQAWGDLVRAVFAALFENLGVRQLGAWWRVGGIVHAVVLPRPPDLRPSRAGSG